MCFVHYSQTVHMKYIQKLHKLLLFKSMLSILKLNFVLYLHHSCSRDMGIATRCLAPRCILYK